MIRIDKGSYGDIDLSGLNLGLMIEIPERMARGNWKVALFVDDRASDEAYEALVTIMSGKARGPEDRGVMYTCALSSSPAPALASSER